MLGFCFRTLAVFLSSSFFLQIYFSNRHFDVFPWCLCIGPTGVEVIFKFSVLNPETPLTLIIWAIEAWKLHARGHSPLHVTCVHVINRAKPRGNDAERPASSYSYRRNGRNSMADVNFQALFYEVLPSTTAVFIYAIGSRKLSANEQLFVGAQAVVSLLQTTQITSDCCFITDHGAYTLAQIKPKSFESRLNSFFPFYLG